MVIKDLIQFVLAEAERLGVEPPNEGLIIQTLNDILIAEVRDAIMELDRDSLRMEEIIEIPNGAKQISLYSDRNYWIGDIIEVNYLDENQELKSADLLKLTEIGTNLGWPDVEGIPTVYAIYANRYLRFHPIPPDGTNRKGYLAITHYTKLLPIVDVNTDMGLSVERMTLSEAVGLHTTTILGELTPFIENMLVFKLTGSQQHLTNAVSTLTSLRRARGLKVVNKLGNLQGG